MIVAIHENGDCASLEAGDASDCTYKNKSIDRVNTYLFTRYGNLQYRMET